VPEPHDKYAISFDVFVLLVFHGYEIKNPPFPSYMYVAYWTMEWLLGII
jgi:hypothetical protein